MPSPAQSPGEPHLLPLFLKLEGCPVLVVGAGEVAERKVTSLLEARASVTLVAPQATGVLEGLARVGSVDWQKRTFEEADVDGKWLVFAATSDPSVQRSIAAAALARRIFCVAVDDPPNASAYSASVVRRPPFTLAISSGGATPALTRLVRELAEAVLPEQEWVAHAQKLRAQWLAEGTPMADRFGQLVRELASRVK